MMSKVEILSLSQLYHKTGAFMCQHPIYISKTITLFTLQSELTRIEG